LLLLESDAELEVVSSRSGWHVGQLVAVACLASFAWLAIAMGSGSDIFALAFPFGAASMVLAWFNARRQRKTACTIRDALDPFPTVGSLLLVRRSVRTFAKTKYRSALSVRRIRHPLADILLQIPRAVAWLMLSPIILFIQMLPDKESRMVVSLADMRGAGSSPLSR
jgi:hypothetical protein